MTSLLILFSACWILGGAQSTKKSHLFTNVGLNDKAFTEGVVFESPAKTAPHCALMCNHRDSCAAFTFDERVCRGHAAVMTSNSASQPAPGARSFFKENNAGRLRLMNGPHPWEGRVEMFYNGTWGTVCDDDWDATDARVVCRQLGYSTSNVTAWSRAYYGQGESTAPIWLDNILCQGSEATLLQCQALASVGSHDCRHYEDAGVSCGGN